MNCSRRKEASQHTNPLYLPARTNIPNICYCTYIIPYTRLCKFSVYLCKYFKVLLSACTMSTTTVLRALQLLIILLLVLYTNSCIDTFSILYIQSLVHTYSVERVIPYSSHTATVSLKLCIYLQKFQIYYHNGSKTQDSRHIPNILRCSNNIREEKEFKMI